MSQPVTPTEPDPVTAEIFREQAVVTDRYRLLDQLQRQVADDLDRVRRSATTGTPAALAERDAFETLHAQRLEQLRRVAERLVFGRLDLTDGAARHIGRIGLAEDSRQVLLDWRAPVAAAFYQATIAQPGEVARRRHLGTAGRTVTDLADEVLQAGALPADAVVVSGQGALFTALEAPRTGRMRDIVATVAAEQDRVIRAPMRGILVVQGGPGTGKTAVALHRAAYLLYTHRDRVAGSGVLLVGPSSAFLRYVSAVLPSLGETSVTATTVTGLYTGVSATGRDSRGVTALKGDVRMAQVLAAAVRDRQRVPDAPQRLDVDGVALTLWPRDVRSARDRARRTGNAHLVARRRFVLDLLDRLATGWATATRTDLDAPGRAEVVTVLRETPAVVRAINRCWLPIGPERLVGDLFGDADRLARYAPWLSWEQRRLLHRPPTASWTPSDIPLLDEAAELLGRDDGPARAAAARAAAERAAELAYAGEVAQLSGTASMLDAATLADRYTGGPSPDADDPDRVFGHVVVDEAQELSAMAWRMLVRRCPSRSMTVVGDVAQTGSAAGAADWAQVFDRLAPGRWRVAELTVNYRTPGPVMALAARALAGTGAAVTVPTSARVDGAAPVTIATEPSALGRTLAELARAEVSALRLFGAGTIAVVTAASEREQTARALLARGVDVADDTAGPGEGDGLVRVLSVETVKGLEFDVAIVVEPAAVVAASDRGPNDLYVALTRPTRRLFLVHARPLPSWLH